MEGDLGSHEVGAVLGLDCVVGSTKIRELRSCFLSKSRPDCRHSSHMLSEEVWIEAWELMVINVIGELT